MRSKVFWFQNTSGMTDLFVLENVPLRGGQKQLPGRAPSDAVAHGTLWPTACSTVPQWPVISDWNVSLECGLFQKFPDIF